MKSIAKKAGIILVILLVIAQFFRIDTQNPISAPEKDIFAKYPAPEAVKTAFQNACYDCHSNQSKYPWYSQVAPVSWWVKNHINEAREELNYSEFADYNDKKANHKLDETIEAITDGWMPLDSYTWMHAEAKLSEQQKAEILDWLKGIQQQDKE